MGETIRYVAVQPPGGEIQYYQGYDSSGEKSSRYAYDASKGRQTKINGIAVVSYMANQEALDKVAGQEYGAASISAKDFLTPDGRPISANDAVLKWKELFPKTQLKDEDILQKVKNEMPQYGGVDEKDKQFAKQGLKQDMYGLQKGAAQAGQQMSNAYGSGMGSSIRSGIGSQKKVAQGFQQAEQSYEQDMYGLQKTAISDFETDLAGFAESFKQGGRVPKKKEKTFLDLLASIPSAGGN